MKILLISGSLRRNSFNTQLALDAKKALEPSCEVRMPDYRNVPMFDQDEEVPMKSVIAAIRADFEWADGIWFFTPEYNGMVPGVLKNLLDWMSRTSVPGVLSSSALYGRYACISGAGGRGATAGSRAQLEKLLKFCGMKIYDESLGIALTPQEMKDDAFADPQRIDEQIAKQAEGFLAWLETQKQ